MTTILNSKAKVKKVKVEVGFFWLLMVLSTFSCSSNSGSNADEAGFFGSASEVDIERMRYDLTEEVIDSVEVKNFLKDSDFPSKLNQTFISFYKDRDYIPGWIDEDGVTEQAEDLLKAIEKSSEHGLNSDDYKYAYLLHLKKKLAQEEVELKDYEKFDKELTAAYLLFGDHLLRGRIDPQSFDAVWLTDRREKDLGKHLQEAIEKDEVLESLEALEPPYDGYTGLKEALAKYEQIKEENKNWPVIPASLKLEQGDSSKQVTALSKILYAYGDLEEEKKEAAIYDEDMAVAIASFQERNGLVQDGILGEETIKMLNISPARRVEQIKLNLERFRWLPEQPEGRHVVVNIPEYRMYVFEGSESVFDMKVIVGEAYQSTTPVFNDTIEYIAFSPTWTVPTSIASEEMLPKLCQDPEYLAKRDFRLYESWDLDAKELDAREINWKKVKKEAFPYRIVQNPGERNALGRVKFMFPNKLDIYLHDTPADYLFDKPDRDFSHGCIRIEKPLEFADYLLEEQNIDRSTIKGLMNMPEPEEIELIRKVPVMIDYRTAWVGADGRVNFREDIYGHDQKQLGPLKDAVAGSDEKKEIQTVN